jgi:hypothetical protein
MDKQLLTSGLTLTLLTILSGCHRPQGSVQPPARPASVQAVEAPSSNPNKSAYFGDLHLHTSWSFDAYLFKTNTTPEDSYRFAQGAEVDYMGRKIKRHAALDFLAVTDHSEFLGVLPQIGDPNGAYANTEWHRQVVQTDRKTALSVLFKLLHEKPPEFLTDEVKKNNWQREIEAAQKYYKPGRFTTFPAYEWSSMPGGANLHRNVIFRGPRFPEKPFSSIDSDHPEDLWAYLDNNRKQGIEALAIPHNSNASNGLMFDYVDSNGNPITADYATARMRNEPLVEIAQTKGQSDTKPELSPTDEFANFEVWNHELASNKLSKPDGSYVRQAYARGEEIETRIGVNPFKYGVVGGSDFHSGISASEENNFPGGHGVLDSQVDPKKLLTAEDSQVGEPAIRFSAGAITGAWAEQNTREAIFDAFKRKEVFATTGVRIKVRFFAGWDYAPDLTKQANWVTEAYAGGVPMGADLPANMAQAKAPIFVLDAVKDPDSGNLDRIQVIKVWFKNGKAQEKVFDAVWAGDRKPDAKTGKLPPVGNTVNLKTATYSNSVGAAELSGVWSDPEFDAQAAAIYYARVLEIPTPRWTTYLAVRNNLPLPAGIDATIQERAWTSPVWYRP